MTLVESEKLIQKIKLELILCSYNQFSTDNRLHNVFFLNIGKCKKIVLYIKRVGITMYYIDLGLPTFRLQAD